MNERVKDLVDTGGLERAVNRACDTIDHLRAQRAELLAALKALLNDIDTGLLVRDITRDGDPGWSQHMLAFVQRLQAAQTAIAKAERRA